MVYSAARDHELHLKGEDGPRGGRLSPKHPDYGPVIGCVCLSLQSTHSHVTQAVLSLVTESPSIPLCGQS